jgi:ubiquinone/menaquinone biosynthesis C-methylase UbiE
MDWLPTIGKNRGLCAANVRLTEMARTGFREHNQIAHLVNTDMTGILEAPNASALNHSIPGPAFEMLVDRSTDLIRHPHDWYISLISRRLETCAYADWLDVGCGWHLDFAWELEREEAMVKKARVVGIDPDWQAVARHRTIAKRTVGFVERLPFRDQCFDMVTANVVVEHLKYPALAFTEIFRVLRSGGCFIFRTPSARSYFVAIARLLPQSLKVWLASKVIQDREPADIYPAHYRANTTVMIGEICKLAGFRKLEITVTRAQGVLGKLPILRRAERATMAALGFTEGNLIVQVWR